MVLAQKQKYRPMEHDRKPRKKTHAPISTLFLTKEARIYNGAKTAFSIMVLGKLDSYMQKNEIRILPTEMVGT